MRAIVLRCDLHHLTKDKAQFHDLWLTFVFNLKLN